MTVSAHDSASTRIAAAAYELQEHFAGEVIQPDDARYDECRALWNGMIDKRPAIIVRPAGVSDVMCALRIARKHDLQLSIKGGGHNVAGHAAIDGGIMVDMGNMNSIHVDPKRRTARVEAGATWAEFDRETAVFGLGTTAGVISSTGVAGLTLGGGIGWLVGRHGLTVDNLISVELVTADGSWLRASEDEHPDLFWALRGGGGNFGIVTSFEFQLHPVTDVLGGYLIYPAEETADVLRFFQEFTENNPEEMTCYFQLGTDPESGARLCMIVVFYPEANEAGYQIIDQVRSFKEPILDTVERMPYQQWQMAADHEFIYGYRYYWKGVLLDTLNDGAMQAIIDHAVEAPLPGCAVAIEHYRGEMNRVAPDATAFANRDAQYQIVIIGGWEDSGDDEVSIQWVRDFHAAAAPHGLAAAFLNFNSSEGKDREQIVRAGYRHNYDRLAEIKRRYDPDNVFNQNNNILPA